MIARRRATDLLRHDRQELKRGSDGACG